MVPVFKWCLIKNLNNNSQKLFEGEGCIWKFAYEFFLSPIKISKFIHSFCVHNGQLLPKKNSIVQNILLDYFTTIFWYIVMNHVPFVYTWNIMLYGIKATTMYCKDPKKCKGCTFIASRWFYLISRAVSMMER